MDLLPAANKPIQLNPATEDSVIKKINITEVATKST